ncbi:MAG: 50S ribosomal protein L4 [candidate division Zixibacteria bacterium SM23_81]|nr:MAG: 50S ribosomal protein L4 [candidate division Zixibacteria bacterium SM23_81]
MAKAKTYTSQGQEKNELDLPDELFGIKPHQAALYSAVRVYLANARRGTASTKGRSEVRGGGAKPWRQKGTGRARAGTNRSPLWVGGGVTFGPKPRQHRLKLPHKVVRLALKSALSSCAQDGRVVLLEDPTLESPKTKALHEILANMGFSKGKRLLVLDGYDENLFKSGQNIPGLVLRTANAVHAYDVLNSDHVIITHKALQKMEEVFSG